MAAVVALLLAIVKAVPTAAAILEQVATAYAAWKTQQNQKDETDKDARIDSAVDAARADLPRLCDTCPFASFGRGQRGPAPATPGVSGSSQSSS